MTTDARVASAISHWAPRFIANGVPASDFQEVTYGISCWEGWCGAWSAGARLHDEMGRGALAAGFTLEDAAHRVTCPLLAVVGKLDCIVPWQGSERLVGEAAGPDRLLPIYDGNHVANNRA